MIQNETQKKDFVIPPVQPVELFYDRISVKAQVQNQVPDGDGGVTKVPGQRNILKECSGKFSPKTFTAIVGPTGSGKTTFLNLLSGRLLSNNLSLHGNLFINGNHIHNVDKFKNLIGYVMQDDFMLPTFTPRETLKFIAQLKLSNRTQEQRDEIVNNLINDLGLNKCADTYVGNSLIKGISGGQKKRTSIGMELLINPSLIFIDEPTTGLDSTTALNLIRLFKRLSDNGRTIISTIHQPSSDIFQEFDKLMLMVDGNIIYNGNSNEATTYFGDIQMAVPIHQNPIDHFMKLMNKEGIALAYIQREEDYTEQQIQNEFNKKIEFFIKHFKKKESKIEIEIKETEVVEIESVSWGKQFCMIAERSIKNELRNPLGLRGKVFQAIFLGILSIILFEKIGEDKNSFMQNLQGAMFFLGVNSGFSAVFGALNVFNTERPVFIRQRQSNTYSTSPYFFGRTCAYLPQQIILPFILVVICYFAIHLNETASSFFFTYFSLFLMNWMGSAYGLFLSTLFEDSEVASTIVPLVVIPFMLVGGFFAPLTTVPDFYKVFEYLSMYKYGYEAIAYAQFHDGFTTTSIVNNVETTYTFTADQYESIFKFEDPYWLNFMMMAIIGIVFRLFALLAMYIISNPKHIDLTPVEEGKKKEKKGRKKNRVKTK